MKKNKYDFGIKVTTTANPKPDAKTYSFKTIEELFDAMTPDNYERLLKEFTMGMEAAFHLRAATHAMANAEFEKKGLPLVGLTDVVKMPQFDWIDD